jgi:hypothetical protein
VAPIRIMGDAVIAAFFAADKPKPREQRAEVESWITERPADNSTTGSRERGVNACTVVHAIHFCFPLWVESAVNRGRVARAWCAQELERVSCEQRARCGRCSFSKFTPNCFRGASAISAADRWDSSVALNGLI